MKIGDLEKNFEANKVVMPKFEQTELPECDHPRRVDELTLRECEEGTQRSVINTSHFGDGRWMGESPLVAEDWHAICQAIYTGVEGAEWENLYYKFVEMNKEVNVRHPSGSSRAG